MPTRESRLPILLSLLSGLLLASGCTPSRGGETWPSGLPRADSTVHAEQASVPPLPPDSFPSDYRRNWDEEWRAPRDVLLVAFKPGTTLEQKTEAIRSIHGWVIGGDRHPPSDRLEGFYMIRIPDTGDIQSALDATDRLMEYDFVETAALIFDMGDHDSTAPPRLNPELRPLPET